MSDTEGLHKANRLCHDYVAIYRKAAEDNRELTGTEEQALIDIKEALKIERMNFYQAALYCKRYMDLFHMTHVSCSVEWCRPRGTVSA